ncbi:histone [Corynebacterium pseudodiphtheriticum]|uniref:histone n=1 Tax=Corynebacterium pseudodiphtheriticum TaxID=37637 RepID=UPI00254BD6E2|nr:histone [Corynebacterium pseudodiphtheriticum]MDK8546600.1 histone [Corynebacterium pseudodiphtheriticum]
MPPKVTDKHPEVEQEQAVEEQTASAARRIVATYAEDFMDGVTLMCMLGVEPEGLVHSKVLAEQNPQPADDSAEGSGAAKKTTKKTSKKASKKATKKSSKKSTKKTAKKASKKSTKKTAKKSAKKTAKKASKKSTAKKSAD